MVQRTYPGQEKRPHIENTCVDTGVCVCVCVCVCVVGVAGKRRWDELGNGDKHLHAAMCITDS